VPVRYEIDVDAGLVMVHLSGRVTGAEIFAYYATLADDPSVCPGLAVLADCRHVATGPSFTEMVAVANAKGLLPDDLRPTRAAVLVSKSWIFGIVRQFSALTERMGIRVMPFYEEHEARAWIATHRTPTDAREVTPIRTRAAG
jgi:hypothetical protein